MGKEEVKLSPFADCMILYIENPKKLHQNTIGTKKFSDAAEYKNEHEQIHIFPIQQ